MRKYELMIILPAEAEESHVVAVVDRVKQSISADGGEVGNIDRWGRRRLAYEIDKQGEGFYVVVEFTALPSSIVPLERALTLADEVVRHKVVAKAA